MIAATLLLFPAPSPRPPGPCLQVQALPRAELLLRGPLEGVQHRDRLGGRLRIEQRLLAGEERRLVVPLARRPDPDLEPAPELEALGPQGAGGAPGGGSASVLGWIEEDLPGNAALRARPRPPVATDRGGPSPAALGTLALAAVVVAALRRRPSLALLGALALVLPAIGLQLRAGPGPARTVRVLEGLRPGGAWLQVDTAPGNLRLEARPAGALGLEVWPEPGPGAGPRWTVRPRPGQVDLWVLDLPDHRLSLLGELDPGARTLDPDLNLWGPLEEVWVRSPEGIWSAHGPWGPGQALPAAQDPSGGPPGWLASRLPQGRGVLVARLGPGAWSGRTLERGEEPREVWLRLVGFP